MHNRRTAPPTSWRRVGKGRAPHCRGRRLSRHERSPRVHLRPPSNHFALSRIQLVGRARDKGADRPARSQHGRRRTARSGPVARHLLVAGRLAARRDRRGLRYFRGRHRGYETRRPRAGALAPAPQARRPARAYATVCGALSQGHGLLRRLRPRRNTLGRRARDPRVLSLDDTTLTDGGMRGTMARLVSLRDLRGRRASASRAQAHHTRQSRDTLPICANRPRFYAS